MSEKAGIMKISRVRTLDNVKRLNQSKYIKNNGDDSAKKNV